MVKTTIVIMIQERAMTTGAVRQIAFALDHSLPCNNAALALAAGVKKAKCTPMTTIIRARAGFAPVA